MGYTPLVRKVLEFVAANAFLLASGLVGAGVLWLAGTAIIEWAPDSEAAPWAWAAATLLAIAAMYVATRRLHQFVRWLIWGRPAARG
jgi:hypothetical protein